MTIIRLFPVFVDKKTVIFVFLVSVDGLSSEA